MPGSVPATFLSTRQGDGFVPAGEYRALASEADYLEQEWIASGTDGAGRPYTTLVYVRRPRDPARFSGTVVVEPLHVFRIAPVYLYASPYILRSGHGWACVVSQKTALEAHVEPTDPERYAALRIESDGAPPGAPVDLTRSPVGSTDRAAVAAWWDELERRNQASSSVLAQVGAALRGPAGPFGGQRIDSVLLVGHSQTGLVTTAFVRGAHRSHRLADGSAVFDGYFPAGFPMGPFEPCDAPIVQVISEGDVFAADFAMRPGYEGRTYRRPDADDPADRYRLYELAGVPHMGTRHAPHDDPRRWPTMPGAEPFGQDTVMNSLPHHELFAMALHHLVRWVGEGVVPPRAARLEVGPDGYCAADAHGNTGGGVRSVQMDVPRATYHPNPRRADGTPVWGAVGTEDAFDEPTMTALYGDHDGYARRFRHRLDELVREGWLLAEDAADMLTDLQRPSTG